MIYFAGCGKFVKIGTTFKEVETRFSSLQTGNPEPIVLLGQMAGGKGVEAELHRRFHALHVRGEWFRHSGELRAFIADIDDAAPPYDALNGDSLFFGLFVGKSLRMVDHAYAQINMGQWWRCHSGECLVGGDPIADQKSYRKSHGDRSRSIVCALRNATRFESDVPEIQRLLRKAHKVKEL